MVGAHDCRGDVVVVPRADGAVGERLPGEAMMELPVVDGMWVLSEMYALMDRCGDDT